jgi:hypothetical protein
MKDHKHLQQRNIKAIALTGEAAHENVPKIDNFLVTVGRMVLANTQPPD